MAPFARGRGSRGNSFRGSRGNGRGRGRGGQKNVFYSTRLEEPVDEEGSNIDSASEAEEPTDLDDSPGSSEEDEDVVASVKPYSALLQSLKSAQFAGEPARKKRKVVENQTHSTQYSAATPAKSVDAIPIGSNNGQADEPEQDASIAASDEEALDEDDDAEDHSDPFESHFSAPTEDTIAHSIADVKASAWLPRKMILKGGLRAVCLSPDEVGSMLSINVRSTREIKLKQKLREKAQKLLPEIGDLHGFFARSMFEYQDALFCERTPKSSSTLRSLVCLHTLNHVLKTRDRVIKNSMRLAKADAAEDLELRDQGFTRPKVLFLLPTRQSCVRAVESIISLYNPEQQENKKRFQDAFSQTEDDVSEDKAEDFLDLFGGNDDDMFRLGLKFTRKTVKLFSQFYGSDIIFASPLGLRMAIGSEDSKKQDHDFLSSVELIVVDHADALLMQNWEHVEYIFEHLNLQPKEAHGCDFSRVRNWYLDGNAKFLRQTIVLSSFNTPEINAIYSRHMLNIAGKVKLSKEIYDGAISELALQLRQTFSRFDVSDPTKDPDTRFKYFTNTIVPTLDRSSKSGSGHGMGVLLFIPSYLDFVRVRNFLANSTTAQNISFGSISEYTSVQDVARARSHFYSGRHSVLLYTGRAHHFRRYRIRGAKKVIMYALPDNPIFYKEIAGEFLVRSISEGAVDLDDATCRTIFSKWDALKLERVVGTKRCGAMLKDNGGDTFDFL